MTEPLAAKARSSAFWSSFAPKLIIVWREGQLGKLWRKDALAGLTVVIVALPLAMALGIASGASPNQGLVTAVIAGFVISLLGGRRCYAGVALVYDPHERNCRAVAELSIDAPAQRASLRKGVEVFRFAGPMFFGVAREMLDVLHRSGRSPKTIILRMERVPYIDSSGASALEAFVRQARGNGTQLILCDLREQPGVFLAKMWSNFAGAEQVTTFKMALDKVSQHD